MPAVRNKPRVDVILRVPKKLPWSHERAVERAAAEAKSAGSDQQRQREQRLQQDQRQQQRQREQQKRTSASSSSTGALVGIPLDGGNQVDSGVENGVGSASNGVGVETSSGVTPSVTVTVPAAEAEANESDGSSQPQSVAVQPLSKPSETSSAEWNSLLIWARRMRGPQWDSGLGMWMVDSGSIEHGSFCGDPTQSINGPPPGEASKTDGEGTAAGQTASSSRDEEMKAPGNEGEQAPTNAASSSASKASPSRHPPSLPRESPLQAHKANPLTGQPPASASSHGGQQEGSGMLPPPHFTPGGGGFKAGVGETGTRTRPGSSGRW